MTKHKLLKIGGWGTAITGVCCATPLLPWLLGLLGLAALTGYLDYVLFPLLAIFLAITIYAAVGSRS